MLRFLPPVAALADGDVAFDGDPRPRERARSAGLLAALRALGVEVDAAAGDRLPFTVHGAAGCAAAPSTVDASESSQFVSGLLLAGCALRRRGSDLGSGRRLPSLPHVEMTVAMLAEHGVAVDRDRRGWRVGRPARSPRCDRRRRARPLQRRRRSSPRPSSPAAG